ncbi:MAG: acyl-CoA desaturase, partial [Myxococcales bacterium]
AVQSGPLSWVANHRLHHRVTDRDLDPHAPGHGFAWAHLVWGLFEHPITTDPRQRQRFIKDLQKDAFLVFCEEHFVGLNCAAVASVFLAGFALGGVARGVSFVAWLIALRVVCAWHITFLTNSVGHKWGYRNFDTPDQSRNVWFLGIVALGDGWHNNHHRFASCARHGRRWFELDLSYRIIVLMERAGVAWGVHHMEEVRRHAVQGDTIRTPQPSGDHHLQPT